MLKYVSEQDNRNEIHGYLEQSTDVLVTLGCMQLSVYSDPLFLCLCFHGKFIILSEIMIHCLFLLIFSYFFSFISLIGEER